MKKPICTPFTYEVPSWFPTFKGPVQGSYLGRKPASVATIRKFLRANRTPADLRNITLGNAYESAWIAK